MKSFHMTQNLPVSAAEKPELNDDTPNIYNFWDASTKRRLQGWFFYRQIQHCVFVFFWYQMGACFCACMDYNLSGCFHLSTVSFTRFWSCTIEITQWRASKNNEIFQDCMKIVCIPSPLASAVLLIRSLLTELRNILVQIKNHETVTIMQQVILLLRKIQSMLSIITNSTIFDLVQWSRTI